MALTAEQETAAKASAKSYLEYSIYVLCVSLGLDPAACNHPYTNPVASGTWSYDAHECLKEQLASLNALR